MEISVLKFINFIDEEIINIDNQINKEYDILKSR